MVETPRRNTKITKVVPIEHSFTRIFAESTCRLAAACQPTPHATRICSGRRRNCTDLVDEGAEMNQINALAAIVAVGLAMLGTASMAGAQQAGGISSVDRKERSGARLCAEHGNRAA
jgi:hypothetical protein